MKKTILRNKKIYEICYSSLYNLKEQIKLLFFYVKKIKIQKIFLLTFLTFLLYNEINIFFCNKILHKSYKREDEYGSKRNLWKNRRINIPKI